MTKQELFSEIRRAESRRDRAIAELQDKCKKDVSAIKERFAKESARFKVGDIIMESHPLYGPVHFTIIRVESFETGIDNGNAFVIYRGRELNPDFAESYGVSGYPRYETIYDDGSHEVKVLTKPLYVSFLVVTASGREIPDKTYVRNLDSSRSILTGTDEEYVIRYGITESGEREEIQKIPNVSKYFRR